MSATASIPQTPDTKTALLLIVCLAQFMVILDVSIVNVALPSIHDGLGFSTTGLQWVVNAYTLTFAGFLMLGGRCADLLGRRRVFIAGTALFSLSSLACALADIRRACCSARARFAGARRRRALARDALDRHELLRGRARAQPRGRHVGRDGRARRLLGRAARRHAHAGLRLAGDLRRQRAARRDRDRDGPAPDPGDRARRCGTRNFDVAGAVLITASLVSLTFGIVRTDTLGWGSAGVLVPLAAGVALLGRCSARRGPLARAPLIPLSILRFVQLRIANLVVTLLYAAFFPVWFFLTLYLQEVLHFDAIEAGLCFLPMTMLDLRRLDAGAETRRAVRSAHGDHRRHVAGDGRDRCC